MKTKIYRLLITTLVLLLICYLLQKFTHKNGNFWSIIPIYWASSVAFDFEMNFAISKKVRAIVNTVLIILVVGLLGAFIYVRLNS